MTSPVQVSTFARLDARLDPRSPAPLAVAVSGGGDSVALLRLAHLWALRNTRPVQVLTVDHGLHPDSPSWAAAAVQAATALNRPARVLTWLGPKPATGLSAAARAARHALLADAAREAGARVLLLGHTADDVAEGDWMRARGATLGALRPWSPSPAWPEGRDLMLLRPLLDISRADLRVWLAAQGATWLDDPANDDSRFARARARAALRSAIVQSSAEAEQATIPASPATLLRFQCDALSGVLTVGRAGFDPLDRHAHARLAAALACASGRPGRPRGPAVAALLLRLAEPGDLHATLAGARLYASGEAVIIGRDPGRIPLPSLPVAAGEACVWDGRFAITPGTPGRIRPAAGRLARLSAADRARLATVPAWARPTLPVLEAPSGGVHLAPARALAAARLSGALGDVRTEVDIARQEVL